MAANDQSLILPDKQCNGHTAVKEGLKIVPLLAHNPKNFFSSLSFILFWFMFQLVSPMIGAGLVSDWVQQNHDGLPQKAGYPQEDVIEVHGSWYDPANPVICYDGTLRRDVFSRMKQVQ